MEEILHQLIGSLSHYLQGLIHSRWCRISSINSSDDFLINHSKSLIWCWKVPLDKHFLFGSPGFQFRKSWIWGRFLRSQEHWTLLRFWPKRNKAKLSAPLAGSYPSLQICPKYPSPPQKCLFWEPGPLLYRFKPLHWRVQGSLGCKESQITQSQILSGWTFR